MPKVVKTTKVAIACQGGGSHAAFSAGVLSGLFGSAKFQEDYDLVALSGTSGGALCAALAWSAMVRTPGRAEKLQAAADALEAFWEDLKCKVWNLPDWMVNWLAVWSTRQLVTVELPLAGRGVCEPALRALIRKHIKLDEIAAARCDRRYPHLFIGATDILTGEGVVKSGCDLTEDMLIASAAVPPLFREIIFPEAKSETLVKNPHNKHTCWDGLFFHNPPVRSFLYLENMPEEIWVIRINPQKCKRPPHRVRDIVDRRNELSGNLSLNQELGFMQAMNELVRKHKVSSEYKEVGIRVVELAGSVGDRDAIRDRDLDYGSKLDRNPRFIEGLMQRGREKADRFFDARSEWEPFFENACDCVDWEKHTGAKLTAAELQAVGKPA